MSGKVPMSVLVARLEHELETIRLAAAERSLTGLGVSRAIELVEQMREAL